MWIAITASLFLLLLLLLLLLPAAALIYSVVFPRHHLSLPMPAPAPPLRRLARDLGRHLVAIASEPRNIDHPENLEDAARYIAHELGAMGYPVHEQVFRVNGVPVRNLEVVIEPAKGHRQGHSASTILVGAHYDSPDDSPGANDNGTGVAGLIELARALREHRPARHRLRFVFFVNEEAPYCKTESMGSWQHAARLRAADEKVEGMIALETLGYFSTRPGSQLFPFPFNRVYRDRGDFIAFVGLPRSRPFLRKALAAFRSTGAFPSIGGVAPGFIEGIDLSDHWSYDQMGYPALMITDTAPFRNPYYHQPDDTPDKVDVMSLARIVTGLEGMLRRIA